MTRGEKLVFWVGSANDDLRSFPRAARRRAGYELHRVQQGLMPTDWKAIPTVGPGTIELRVRTESGGQVEHRVFFVAKFEEAVWVLHAFRKTTRKTSRRDIEIGRRRYAAMLQERSDVEPRLR